MKINVSSSINKELYERWKKTGIKLNHIITLGIMNAEHTPGYLQRICELEEGNNKLQAKIGLLAKRIAELEAQ